MVALGKTYKKEAGKKKNDNRRVGKKEAGARLRLRPLAKGGAIVAGLLTQGCSGGL